MAFEISFPKTGGSFIHPSSAYAHTLLATYGEERVSIKEVIEATKHQEPNTSK